MPPEHKPVDDQDEQSSSDETISDASAGPATEAAGSATEAAGSATEATGTRAEPAAGTPGDAPSEKQRSDTPGTQTPTLGGARAALPRAVIILLGVAAAMIAAVGLREVAAIAAPTFLALTLVITVHPLLTFLVRHKIPKWLAGLVCLIVVYIVVLGLMGALALSIAQLIIVMPDYTDKFVNLYNETITWLTSLGLNAQQLQTALDRFDPTTLIPAATSVLSSTLNATSTLVFLLTVLVFIVMDAGDFPHRMELAAKQRESFVGALRGFAQGVRRYWLVSAVFGLIVAVLDVTGLYIIGVPLALMWGLLSFITNFIPNIGFVLGVIPPALLALLDGGVSEMVAVIIVYAVLNLVVQVIIQPRFTGDAVGVTTTVTFLSLAIWAIILGPLGALLALPATLFVKSMLVDADPKSRWLNALISSRPAAASPPP